MARLITRRQQKQAQYYTEDLENGIELDMILIPGGNFLMGSPENELERLQDEGPQHPVNVPSFSMGKYPITQEQWKAIALRKDLKVSKDLDPEPSYFKEDPSLPSIGGEREAPLTKGGLGGSSSRWTRPVENVSWYDAKEFCARLSQKTKREYRLPTEAEWEYACRAGTTTPFHFGETITTNLANYRGTDRKRRDEVDSGNYGRGPKGEYREQTTPVGYFQVANAFGLYDMHGNIWEWCEDDWHDNYNDAPKDGSAWLSAESEWKVLRGGSWYINPGNCRSASRVDALARVVRLDLGGFRVVGVLPRTS